MIILMDTCNNQKWLKYVTISLFPNFQLPITQYGIEVWIITWVWQYFFFGMIIMGIWK
jgi:hypothetical protein